MADPERDCQKMQGKKLGLVLLCIKLRELGVASFESFDEKISVLLREFNSAGNKRIL
jgi:hypothetical protein